MWRKAADAVAFRQTQPEDKTARRVPHQTFIAPLAALAAAAPPNPPTPTNKEGQQEAQTTASERRPVSLNPDLWERVHGEPL